MATIRQKRLAEAIALNGVKDKPDNKQVLLENVGYAESVATHKPKEILESKGVVEALRELGFDSNNAKRVVGEILNDDSVEEQHRLKAASLIFDVNGDKAPEKVIYLNIEPKPNDAIRELANGLLNRQRE